MIIVRIVLAGLAGTLLMSTLMTFIHRSGWANADMIRALGSLATRSYDNSLFPGLAMHFGAGIVFAVPYTLILDNVGALPSVALVFVGGAIGVLHGAGMSYVLLAMVAENHPVEKFRKVGFEVAAAHVAGHAAYGVGVGIVCALFGAT